MTVEHEVAFLTKQAAIAAGTAALADDQAIPAEIRMELLALLAAVVLVLRTDPQAVVTMFKAAANYRLGSV